MNFKTDYKAMLSSEFSEFVIIDGLLSVSGIFDETYQMVDPNTGLTVMSTKPRVTIFEDDVQNHPLKVGTTRIEARGKLYRLIDKQPDGQGGTTLYLD